MSNDLGGCLFNYGEEALGLLLSLFEPEPSASYLLLSMDTKK